MSLLIVLSMALQKIRSHFLKHMRDWLTVHPQSLIIIIIIFLPLSHHSHLPRFEVSCMYFLILFLYSNIEKEMVNECVDSWWCMHKAKKFSGIHFTIITPSTESILAHTRMADRWTRVTSKKRETIYTHLRIIVVLHGAPKVRHYVHYQQPRICTNSFLYSVYNPENLYLRILFPLFFGKKVHYCFNSLGHNCNAIYIYIFICI